MTEPIKYEVGGFLTDANGAVHEITGADSELVEIGSVLERMHFSREFAGFFRYSAPVRLVPMTRELQEALEQAVSRSTIIEVCEYSERLSEIHYAYRAAKEAK